MKTPMPIGQAVLRNVLFATDFSAASMRALPYAASLARQYGAKLHVSHVVPIESYLLGDAQAVERLRLARAEAESNLTEIVSSPAVGSIPMATLLDNGDIWSVLQGFIEQYSIDMLVVGTTGRTGFGKVLLGSVAEEAIRELHHQVFSDPPSVRGRARESAEKSEAYRMLRRRVAGRGAIFFLLC
jgi:nucleotide-binding universal stress UspA family protein